mgnify:FL=1
MNETQRITDLINTYSNILLVIHQFPDGDTIASSLALYIALKKLEKNVTIACNDSIPEPFLFLPKVREIKRDFLQGDWDLIIVLDCGDLRRTGFSERIKAFATRKKHLINIDHHPRNDLHKIANVNFFDESVAAVAELVEPIITHLGVKIEKEIATCLLMAIYTDTGGFMHSNTTPKTLSLASRMLSCGARLKLIAQNINNSKTLPSLKLWGKALERIVYNSKYEIVYSIITQKDILECGAEQSDVAGVVNLINSVPGASAVILFCEYPDNEIRVSLRTEQKGVDLSRLANYFGGGGHKKAAGFSFKGKMSQFFDF